MGTIFNHKQERKEYLKNNPEQFKLTQQKYRETHRAECNERWRIYKEKNIEKIREYGREYQRKKRELQSQNKTI